MSGGACHSQDADSDAQHNRSAGSEGEEQFYVVSSCNLSFRFIRAGMASLRTDNYTDFPENSISSEHDMCNRRDSGGVRTSRCPLI